MVGPALGLVAHVAAVFGGALFMVLCFAGFQGVLINVLPHRVFRRLSPVIQMLSITLLLALFLTIGRATSRFGIELSRRPGVIIGL
jgi:hypothetical protein